MTNATCILTGCQRKPYCRKMCKPHYEAERGYNLKPRARPKVSFLCKDCGNEHEVDKRELNRRKLTRCPPCARKHGWAKRERTPKPPPPPRLCPTCGDPLIPKRGQQYCGDECRPSFITWETRCAVCDGQRSKYSTYCDSCRTERKRDARRTHKAKRRALTKGADAVSINSRKIFERDGWMCGICRKRVDPKLTYPHSRSASLDHIIPLADGGKHAPENVQCSHAECNRKKWHTGAGQLILFA